MFVDGILFSENGALGKRHRRRAEIAGVEIYSGPATIPLEYKRQGTKCGVILIWTRAESSGSFAVV